MHEEPDWPQNVLLMKNLQFLFNFDETLSKSPKIEIVNWTKFGQDWTKIVDFSLIANFEACLIFYASVFMYSLYYVISLDKNKLLSLLIIYV